MLNGNGTAYAQTATPVSPLYVTWFFGNGSLPGRWKPAKTGSGAAWDLSPQLQPLASFKSYLTVISGLENKLVVSGSRAPDGIGRGHDRRAAQWQRRAGGVDRSDRRGHHLDGGALPLARGGRDAGDAERQSRTRCTRSRTRGRTRATTRSSIPRRCSRGLFMGMQSDDDRPRTRPRSSRTCGRACSTPSCRTARACSSGSGRPTRRAWSSTSRRFAPSRSASDAMPASTHAAVVHQSRRAPTIGQGHEERGAAGGEHRHGRPRGARARLRDGRACFRSCSRCPPRTSTTGTSRRT